MKIIIGFLVISIGYLLGSFLPAYFLGRIHGIDIREKGQGNPGTVNTYHVLGLWAAIITAFYDTLKGIGAMGLALFLGAPPVFIYLAGIFAIIGHIFPFYLKFKGGQGVAVSTGLLLTYLIILLKNGWFPWQDLLFLAGLTLTLLIIFRRGSIIGIVVLPALYLFILINSASAILSVFAGLTILYILFINLSNIYTYKLFKLKPETKRALKHLRVFLRPVAIIFPLLYLLYSRKVILTILGSVALFFILVDLLRLFSKRVNAFLFEKFTLFFKEKERHTFSTASLFLASSFLTILVFDKAVATTAIIFLIFGDIFAKFTGLEHGKFHLFNKTIDGTLAYFASCLVAGFLWSHLIPLSFSLVFVGSLAAAITELLPLGVNDNFAIPLISAAVMRVVQLFF